MTATEAARSGDAGMRAKVCEALASLRFSGRTPVSETVIQVVKDFMKGWLQTTRDSLERSVLPLLPDPAAREQVTEHFRSHLGWLDGLETRKLEGLFKAPSGQLARATAEEGAPSQEEEEAQARLE